MFIFCLGLQSNAASTYIIHFLLQRVDHLFVLNGGILILLV